MDKYLTQMKIFSSKNSQVIVIAVLLFISLINPFIFNFYYGHHEKQSDTSYTLQDTAFYTPEYYVHARFLYEAYKNLKLHRFDTLSIIDETNPLYSFPHFQFYNIAPSYILGLFNFLFQDIINTYIFGVWIATFVYGAGIYLLVRKITKSIATSLLISFVCISSPYYITNLLTRSAFSEYIAISLIPLLIFQLYNLVLFCNKKHENNFVFKYLLYASLFVISSTIFFLTHNITSIFSIIFLGFPILILIIKKIKPNLRSLILLIPPLLFVLGNVLFYWIPVILYGSKTVISTSYFLLQTGLQWSPWNVVLSILPTSSPGAVNTELYLQIGLPILLLLVFFFNWKYIYVYIQIAIIFILVCFNVWPYIPQIFHSVQFSFRLLAYIPILLLLIAKKLNKFTFSVLLVVSIFSAVAFYSRNSSFFTQAHKSFSNFPTINDWSFYQNSNFNVPLESSSNPVSFTDVKPVEEILDDKQVMDLGILENTDNKIKAVTFEITLKTLTDKYENIFFYHDQKWDIKEDVNYGVALVPVGNKFVLSACVTNIKKSKFSLVNLAPKTNKITSIDIKKYDDSQNFYLDGVYPSTCDYRYNSKENSFEFIVDKVKGRQVILPFFYSPDNRITTGSGKEVDAKGGLYFGKHSYTVIDGTKIDSKILNVKILANNKFIIFSKLSILLTFVFFIISILYLFIFRIFK